MKGLGPDVDKAAEQILSQRTKVPLAKSGLHYHLTLKTRNDNEPYPRRVLNEPVKMLGRKIVDTQALRQTALVANLVAIA